MVSLLLLSALSSNCIIIPQRVGSSSSFLARPRLDVGKNMGSSAFPVRVNWAIGKPPLPPAAVEIHTTHKKTSIL